MKNDSDIAWIGHGHTAKGRCKKCGGIYSPSNKHFHPDEKDRLTHDCAAERAERVKQEQPE